MSTKIKSQSARAVVMHLRSRKIPFEFRKSTNHYRLDFVYRGYRRSITMSKSPSDSMAHKQALREIKRKLEELDELADNDTAPR